MKRRDFIRKAGLATAGAIAAPYILPSGRLFAATGMRRANHVVFCLYAGGVRNLDTIQKMQGNLLPNMLKGSESIPADIQAMINKYPLGSSPLALPLQTYGTLFKQFKYESGPTGHFNGHTTAVTGAYTTTDLNFKQHPATPTIFELYRKHTSPSQSALKCWWVSNTLGPYPVLNYSTYPGYGADYAANFIAPTYLIGQQGYDSIGNLKTFSSSEEAAVNNIRNMLNHNFGKSYTNGDAGVTNTAADAANLQSWITSLLNRYKTGQLFQPWSVAASSMNNDMYNIAFAEEIIKTYTPEMLVVNMQDVDVCHTDFTKYCNNLHRADYAVAHLWSTIQSTPGMMNDTIMIVAPEHGRNLDGNSTLDANGKAAIDHTASVNLTGDQTARDIFCLVVGPPGAVKQNQEITTVSGLTGESTEIVLAMANILGFDQQVPSSFFPKSFYSSGIQAAFV